MEYPLSKQLECQLLNYLNVVQPLQYINTNTNEPMRVVPYYPSLFKYSQFDIYNDYILIELKSRSKKMSELQNNILDTYKVLNNNSIFFFTYDNIIGKLNDLHYITYDAPLFDSFEIQITSQNKELFVIPIWTSDKMVKPYMIPLTTNRTQSHPIYINYSEQYKSQLEDIITTDRAKYLKTFGIYSIA
jgi:hypothetical protein